MSPASAPDAAALLNELQARRQELEQQGLELCRLQQQLAQANDRYRELFEQAPVGYLTLDVQGRIVECNLMAQQLLQCGGSSLLGRPLSAVLGAHDVDRWHGFRRQLAGGDGPRRIDLAFQRRDGGSCHGQLECLSVPVPLEPAWLRVTLTDGVPRREADASRAAALRAMASHETARQRVSRELHDDLGQRLSAVKMALSGVAGHAQADLRLAEVQQALDEAVDQVRCMAAELRPPMLDDLGIVASIEWLARETRRRSGLDVRLKLSPVEPDLDGRTALTVYRVLERVLLHVAEHAAARDLRVGLAERSGGLVLEVRWRVGRRGFTGPGAAGAGTLSQKQRELMQGADLLGYRVQFMPGAGGAHGIVVAFPAQAVDSSLPGAAGPEV